MRSIKPITIVLVIGAFALSAFGVRLANPAATLDRGAAAHASQGGAAAGANRGSAGAAEVHISAETVQRINELLRLYGIPLVLSRSDPLARPTHHGVAVCVASGGDPLIVAGPIGGN